MTTDNFHKRFARAKAQMGVLVKDSTNPFFRSTYASLGACLNLIEPALSAEGISLVESSVVRPDDKLVQVAELIDLETETMMCSASLPLVAKDPNNPQELGSAISYARRYLIMTICSLHAEDDDGNAATQRTPPKQEPPKQEPARHVPAKTASVPSSDINDPNNKTYHERAAALYAEYAKSTSKEAAMGLVSGLKTHKERCAALSKALDDVVEM